MYKIQHSILPTAPNQISAYRSLQACGIECSDEDNTFFYNKIIAKTKYTDRLVQGCQTLNAGDFPFADKNNNWLYKRLFKRPWHADNIALIVQCLQKMGILFSDADNRWVYKKVIENSKYAKEILTIFQAAYQCGILFTDTENKSFYKKILGNFKYSDNIVEVLQNLKKFGFIFNNINNQWIYEKIIVVIKTIYTDKIVQRFQALQACGFYFDNADDRSFYEKIIEKNEYSNLITHVFLTLQTHGISFDNSNKDFCERIISKVDYVKPIAESFGFLQVCGFSFTDIDNRHLYEKIIERADYTDKISEGFEKTGESSVDFTGRGALWLCEKIIESADYAGNVANGFKQLHEGGFKFTDSDNRWLYEAIIKKPSYADGVASGFIKLQNSGMSSYGIHTRWLYEKVIEHAHYADAVAEGFKQLYENGFKSPGCDNRRLYEKIIENPATADGVARGFITLHKSGMNYYDFNTLWLYEKIIENPYYTDKIAEIVKQLHKGGFNFNDSNHQWDDRWLYEQLIKNLSDADGIARGFITLHNSGMSFYDTNTRWLYEKVIEHSHYADTVAEGFKELQACGLSFTNEANRWIYEKIVKDKLDYAHHLILALQGLREIGYTVADVTALYRKILANPSQFEKEIREYRPMKAPPAVMEMSHAAQHDIKEIPTNLARSLNPQYLNQQRIEACRSFVNLYMKPHVFIENYKTKTSEDNLTTMALVEILRALLTLAKKYPFHPFFPRNQVIKGVVHMDVQHEPFAVIERLISSLQALPDELDVIVVEPLFCPILEHPDLSEWAKELLMQLLHTIHISAATVTLGSVNPQSLPLNATEEDFKLLKSTLLDIKLDSPMDEHVSWVFKAVLGHPYRDQKAINGIMRPTHGIQHAARAALFIPVFYALYRYFQPEVSLSLNQLKLLQITALWHDTGRTKDGADTPENEKRSAQYLYYYLTEVLGVDIDTARIYQNAIINKDVEHNTQDLIVRLLYEVDCIDVMRAKNFDAQYLYFHRIVVSSSNENTLPFDVEARLITEIGDLIRLSGDSFLNRQYDLKSCFEHEKAWACLLNLLNSENHPLLKALFSDTNTASEMRMLFPNATTTDTVIQAFREGRLLMRGVRAPSYYYHKPGKSEESLANKELRKIYRRSDIPTRSGKLGKFGNLQRSMNLIGASVETFSDAGFLTDIAEHDILMRSAVGFKTGYGKREKNFSSSKLKAFPTLPALFQHMRKGGSAYFYEAYGVYLTHNEIVAPISKVSAIVYAESSSFSRRAMFFKDKFEQHSFVPILQALFLRYAYAEHYQNMRKCYIQHLGEAVGLERLQQDFGASSILPIYRYASSSNQFEQYPEDRLTETHIVHLWVTVCVRYLEQCDETSVVKLDPIDENKLDKIKICAVYGPKKSNLNGFHDEQITRSSADSNYPLQLRQKINNALCDNITRFVDDTRARYFRKFY